MHWQLHPCIASISAIHGGHLELNYIYGRL